MSDAWANAFEAAQRNINASPVSPLNFVPPNLQTIEGRQAAALFGDDILRPAAQVSRAASKQTFLNQLVQQANQGYGRGQVTPSEVNSLLNMSGQPSLATGTAMNRAAAVGQVTPGELVDDMYRQVGRMTPEMALPRPTAIGAQQVLSPTPTITGQMSASQLALGPGTPGGGLAVRQPPLALGPGTPGGGLAVRQPLVLGPGTPGGSLAVPSSSMNPIRPTGTTGSVASAARATSASGVDLSRYTLSEADLALNGTAQAGKLGAINTRLTQLLPGNLAVNMTVGSLMSGLGVATTGLMASGWVDSKNLGGENSNWDRGISGGLKGAALFGGGAIALGLASGPVGWAALGGAALFGLGEAFIWGEDKSTKDQMQEAIAGANTTIDNLINNPEFGIDTDTAQQVRLQVAATTQFFLQSEDKAGLDQYLKSLASTVPSFLMQASEQNKANQQRMKLQAAYGPVYASMMERSAQANQQAFATQMQSANQIADPNIRGSLQAQAAQSYKSSQELNAAYAQQVAGATTQLPAAAQAVQDQVAAMQQQYLQPTQ